MKVKFETPYPRHVRAALTKGRDYEVLDVDQWLGNYLILDDEGERRAVDWLRFEDKGKRSDEFLEEISQ